MEEYKIYRVGNYIKIVNIHNYEIFNGAAKEVFVDSSNVGKAEYRFFNVKNWKETKSLKLDQIKKQDGTAYTLAEWESFYMDNSVTFGGGSGGTSVLHITSNTTLQNIAGELVFMQTMSDGTVVYLNPDKTSYLGNTSLLLPYSNSLIEFEVTMSLSANSDAVYDITPAGSEIRDYQVFDLSNPSQDISGQVSGVVSNLHQLRLHTTIAIPQLQIKGTRTKV